MAFSNHGEPIFHHFFNAKVATLKEQRAGVRQEKKETLVLAGPRSLPLCSPALCSSGSRVEGGVLRGSFSEFEKAIRALQILLDPLPILN